jgi:hypothetical protein
MQTSWNSDVNNKRQQFVWLYESKKTDSTDYKEQFYLPPKAHKFAIKTDNMDVCLVSGWGFTLQSSIDYI